MLRTAGTALLAGFIALTLAACTPDATPAPSPRITVTATVEAQTTVTLTPAPTTDPDLVPNPYARPAWLGTVPLDLQENKLGPTVPTPEELQNRQLEPRPTALEDPENNEWFATVTKASDEVIARSSWIEECPVPADELSYIVMPFWGFDNKPHTGEMLINSARAEEVVPVFKYMFEARFPIEEMRVTTREEVNGVHYGDQNVTSSFECRRSTGGYATWGEHASGMAIDINPFHNPWVRDGAIYPELAGAYKDRRWLRPGMIETQKSIVTKFKGIGWSWGG